MKKVRIALVAGHSHSKIKNGKYYMNMGASSEKYGLHEWVINKTLIGMILPHLNDSITPILVDRDNGTSGYSKLPAKINKEDPDFIIEFHDNSSFLKTSNVNPDELYKVPKGNEVLYYAGSVKSKKFATLINNTLYETLKVKDRGIVPIRTSKENGFHILKYTNAPCIIVEPAFFSNDEDTKNLMINYNSLAVNIADTLNKMVEDIDKK